LPSSKQNRFFLATALFHLGRIAYIENNYNESEYYFLELSKQKYNYRQDLICKAYFNLFSIYNKNDQKLKALESISKYIDCEKENDSKGYGLRERSIIYSKLNEVDLCIRDLKESCELGFKNSCDILNEIEMKK
jgi:tetratricopeptide (TPR) repeat protein